MGAQPPVVNGTDTDALRRPAAGVAEDASLGIAEDCARGTARFEVRTAWKGGTRSGTRVASHPPWSGQVRVPHVLVVPDPSRTDATAAAAWHCSAVPEDVSTASTVLSRSTSALVAVRWSTCE